MTGKLQSDPPGLPLLSRGFRPFFLASALYAGLIVPLWSMALAQGIAIGPAGDTLGWHAHEMLFGYVGGVFAGFLLTALPNWTGRPPVSGGPLLGLLLLWLAGRLEWALALESGIALLIDEAFLVAMAAYASTEAIAARKWSALPVCALAALFALAHIAADHAERLGLDSFTALRLALGVMTVLMGLIGGRIIPAFTTNWLRARGDTTMVPAFSRGDAAAVIALAAAALAWAFFPASPATAFVAMAASTGCLWRLSRWQGWKTLSEPLLAMLHIAYLWLPVALLAIAISAVRPDAISPSVALHAVTAGAIGSLTIAVMTRATLGHTGRPLVADRVTMMIYGLVLAGGILRIALPETPLPYGLAIAASGCVWAAGFLLFVLAYGPLLVQPRVRG